MSYKDAPPGYLAHPDDTLRELKRALRENNRSGPKAREALVRMGFELAMTTLVSNGMRYYGDAYDTLRDVLLRVKEDK